MTQPLPNPYGSDFWIGFAPGPNKSAGNVLLDADPSLRTVTGRALLVQSLLCRQTTPRGSVIDCPNDCLDIRDFLRAGVTSQAQAAFQGQLQTEIAKEQCVQSVSVSVVWNLSAGSMVIAVVIVSALGPFTLTVAAAQITVTTLLNGAPLGPIA